MKFVILNAGRGKRLGRNRPKCLSLVDGKRTLLDCQLRAIREFTDEPPLIVVGYKPELIMPHAPDSLFCFNPRFQETNTAYSLNIALSHLPDDDVVWINGDVYLEIPVLKKIVRHRGSCVLVNRGKCGQEEVKYSCARGMITQIGKKITGGEGEALGLNKVSAKDLRDFKRGLRMCRDNDYFEYGMQKSIRLGVKWKPVCISGEVCMEVDFNKDLNRLRKSLKKMRDNLD